MQSMAFEQRPEGFISIFCHGRQYRREPNGSWTKRTYKGWRTVSARRARRLERAYRHRDELKKVQRFLRSEPESRIAELVQRVLTSIAQRRKANIEIGRACNELKRLVGHGRWQIFFKNTFLHRLNLRTAERYMELARKEDANSKIDTLSNFQPSSSERARKMHKSTKRAEAEVASARRHDPASVIESTINALRRSSHWRAAAPQIIAYLRQLCRKYGVVIAIKNTEGSAAA